MKYLILIFCSLWIFTACKEDEDILTYSKARSCLDAATAATARGCVSELASDSSARASKLRCAAEFIAQGLDTSTLAQIFSDIQGDDGAALNSAMSSLYFKAYADLNSDSTTDGLDAVVTATNAYTDCNSSLSKGMAMLGSFAYSATLMANLSGAWDGVSAPDLTAPASLPTTNDAELGAAVLNIQTTYCSTGSANEDLCGQIQSIIGGLTNPADIGAALRGHIEP